MVSSADIMASASTYLQAKVGKNMADLLPNSDANKEKSLSPKDQIKGHKRNKSPKLRKLDQYGEKAVSLTKCEAAAKNSSPKMKLKYKLPWIYCQLPAQAWIKLQSRVPLIDSYIPQRQNPGGWRTTKSKTTERRHAF